MKRFALAVWNGHRDKVLYLVVGAWNTLFQFGCFSLLYYVLHDHVFSSWILVITHVITSINGFLGYRYIVFGSRGHPLGEYIKYQLVWLPLFLINLAVLPLALTYSHLNAYVIQGIFGAFAIVVGYLGGKYFAFTKGQRSTRAAPIDQ